MKLDSKQLTRIRTFFPPLVFIQSLDEICDRRAVRKESDAPPSPNQGTEEKFHTFVNKLAQICDYRPHGDTVTALAVLQESGRVLYVFASNRRARPELLKTGRELTAVLKIIKDNLEAATQESDEVIQERLLRLILVHNNVRIRSYLTSLDKGLGACIEACERETTRSANLSKHKDKANINPSQRLMPLGYTEESVTGAAGTFRALLEMVQDTKDKGQTTDECQCFVSLPS